jgi:hypothetical protein
LRARDDQSLDAGEPAGDGFAAGCAHQRRRVDDRRVRSFEQFFGRIECRAAAIRVADRIEDQAMEWNRRIEIGIVDEHARRCVAAIVEKAFGLHIAAPR